MRATLRTVSRPPRAFRKTARAVAPAVGGPAPPVVVEGGERGRADRDDALLPSFAEDAHDRTAAVDVLPVELRELAHADAGRVQQLEDRAVAGRKRPGRAHAVEDAKHLVDREVRREEALALRGRERRGRIVGALAVAGAMPKEVLERGELPRDRRLASRACEAREPGTDAVHVDVGEAAAALGEEARELTEVGAVAFDGVGRGVRLVREIGLEALDQPLRHLVQRRIHAVPAHPARTRWCAPTRPAWYQSRRRCRNAMAPTTEAVTMTSRSGVRLAGVLHLPAGVGDPSGRPAVVLCHGMESTKEGTKHQALAARLVARGYVCLRFDFSYVGESGGRFADLTISGEVDDLGGAVDFLTARGSTTFAVVGSSLGGTVAVLFAGSDPRVRRHGDHRGGRVAARHHRADGAGRARGLAAPAVTAERAARSSAVGFLDDLERIDVLGAAGRVTAATLVTHGEVDRVVPVADAYALFAALPEPKALAITPACDHRFSDPDHLETLLDRTVDWIATRFPPGSPA